MPKMKTRPSHQANASLLSKLDLISLFDSIIVGILFVDQERRVVMINRFLEALTGYNREDVVGVHGENVMRSNLLSLGDPLGKALDAGITMTLEGDIINQARKKVPIRFTVSPLKFATGNKAGACIIL
jgi:PAS domain S-box-containing protein